MDASRTCTRKTQFIQLGLKTCRHKSCTRGEIEEEGGQYKPGAGPYPKGSLEANTVSGSITPACAFKLLDATTAREPHNGTQRL